MTGESLARDEGQTTIEYAFVVVLVLGLIIVMATGLDDVMTTIVDAINAVIPV